MLGLRLRLGFLLKLEDARVDPIGHFGKHQQVIATEALRGFPLLAFLVEAGEGDIVLILLKVFWMRYSIASFWAI